MNAVRTAALATAISLATAFSAPAMTVADFASAKMLAAAPLDFGFAGQPAPGALPRLDKSEAASAETDRYFDYDALITLGALALAGGAVAAFGSGAARRKETPAAGEGEEEPAWRDSVFRAIQADLAQFTDSYHRAA